jgi:hypothetical protein
MRTYQTILFPAAFGPIGIFWLSTLFILREAPLFDGPLDEANRALAIFVRDTAISLSLMVALSVFRRRTQQWAAGKPREGGMPLEGRGESLGNRASGV